MIIHNIAMEQNCKCILTLAAKKLTTAMERITEWLDQSYLSLNISKIKGMFFSNTSVKAPTVDIFISKKDLCNYRI